MIYLPLILIPLCALLDHLGGQSTAIPNPRITCRVFGITAAFSVIALLSGFPVEKLYYVTPVVLAGMALWAAPGWASGFSCVGGCEDGRQDTFLSSIVNRLMGISYLDKLTLKQCWRWGVIYFTLRGLYIYPLFAGLGYLVSPWAYLIGLSGALQGLIYGNAKTVYNAEWIMGALVGIMLATTVMAS